MDYFDEEPEKRFANQYSEQQILASGYANQNIGTINSRCTTLGKRQNDGPEGTPKEKRQDTTDVLSTARAINKANTNDMEDNNIYITSVNDTPQKKKRNEDQPLPRSHLPIPGSRFDASSEFISS
ncbi:16305_t:CDS:2 [Acaulospora colombiana]|uniref:16305_t:CDS:1 n=1 Tax=Acaulospora colombiana TaxID=27376 RepID=A0ACA9JYL4_9GLOM|nr:16305_t:CDS:2 [Acaulospora colombiana]